MMMMIEDQKKINSVSACTVRMVEFSGVYVPAKLKMTPLDNNPRIRALKYYCSGIRPRELRLGLNCP